MRIPAPRTAAAVLAGLVLALASAAPAAAHNQLTSASPAKNATLAVAPKAVALTFMQPLNPDFTTITVTDGNQQAVPTGAPAVAGTKGTVTISRALANGTYRVAYRVVSTDGHPVQGSYTFTVDNPAATTPPTTPAGPTAAPSPSRAASADPADGGLSVGWLVGGAIVLLAVAAAAGLLLRRRATNR
ncbi:hypothetical protein GCM10010123_01050 [Pilimelia anulata]|uniref:CopC domain-containing protein n=1 Tax=Pilimelia anulata TaxID=53371 RepID=A0A8J3B135_9ACTN|nr:copper resistance CopC family protein [Pilimelia anulata]GGJ74863.1 hypothetical protein GCM10010123_01050 [Pilimelia anulata]